MHFSRTGLAFLLLVLPICSSYAAEAATERADWKKHFDYANAKGTIVVIDERASSRGVFDYDTARAKVRYSPASTFKVPHTLFALHAGAVRDEFQIFRWDGLRRTEWPEGPVFFAMNIDTPNRSEDLGKRQTITKAVLRSIQALPADPGNGAAR